MKSLNLITNRLSKDKKAVFGLTSVQEFFAIILGVALLAYVIVIIFSALQGSTILAKVTGYSYNETGWVNSSGYQLKNYTVLGFSNPSVADVRNGANVFPAANYTLNYTSVLYNVSGYAATANITYSYLFNSDSQNQLDAISQNTSGGITGFFTSINPVYAILAILVIILVLVVLVRVVTGTGIGSGGQRVEPQL